MPYKVTYLFTKPDASVPDFRDWIKTVPSTVLDPFPSAAGRRPGEVMKEVQSQLESAPGFVSRIATTESDGLTIRTEFIWETEEDWRTAEAKGQVESLSKYLRDLYTNTFNIQIQKIEESI